ncbi:hypothetical protein A2994_03590 [candidate division Kazan bacterium RIFCSPLOWO2_01_FULL_48_13]|uniref:PIN domain-containing protein n=1 Tax=candidate division Kazan bacterium RIFCSPLOWO2_01_FULL_48_13 TaxID=1798539 RepID=A0A1F4PNR7_UNCK3|nr:MAG: hypothetical protein A2994_03590 [candidate division Kazan bacterium RIFCSPLOWO2_01_FULL_48_13]
MVIKKSDKFLLDSDISIWILRKKTSIADAVIKTIREKTAGVSILTVSEIYKGGREQEEKIYSEFFNFHSIFPIEFKIAKHAGEYWKKYKHVNNNIVDYLIASTCKYFKLTLLTLNTKHFPMKDIKVINPLENLNVNLSPI